MALSKKTFLVLTLFSLLAFTGCGKDDARSSGSSPNSGAQNALSADDQVLASTVLLSGARIKVGKHVQAHEPLIVEYKSSQCTFSMRPLIIIDGQYYQSIPSIRYVDDGGDAYLNLITGEVLKEGALQMTGPEASEKPMASWIKYSRNEKLKISEKQTFTINSTEFYEGSLHLHLEASRKPTKEELSAKCMSNSSNHTITVKIPGKQAETITLGDLKRIFGEQFKVLPKRSVNENEGA